MKTFILTLILSLLTAGTGYGATFYVRTDGGDSTECTGLTDAAYSGSGTGQDCAWKHPFEALPPGGTARIEGGDTLLIKSGSYRMGHTPGVYDSGACNSSWPWDCRMISPPTGPDATHPTRILGEGWESGCNSAPELYGVEKAKSVFLIKDTANIEMKCLEITDHENCSTNTTLSPDIQCNRSFPYGDYAQKGIEMRNVTNWYMDNINIHGFMGPGIQGAEITDWTVTNSKISYNSAGGINAETPAASSNQFYGVLTFNNTDVSWNGCTEDYPNVNNIVKGSCVGGNSAGYGDGVGLALTGGEWHWSNCSFIGNVEDGLDMLYMRSMTGISYISDSFFQHNAGNDLKTSDNTIITNNILTGDCNYFNDKPIVGNVVSCRGNATLSITLQKDSHSATIANNSFGGQSDIMISLSSGSAGQITCDGTERVSIVNNIFRGGSHFQLPDVKVVDAYYIYDTCSGFSKEVKNNLFYNNKDGANDCTNSINSICGVDPLYLVFDEANDSYDFRLQEMSPALDNALPTGTQIGYNFTITTTPSLDYYGSFRTAPDIGMHEVSPSNAFFPIINKIENR